MGCDIHAQVEWKRRPDWWVTVLSIDFMPRDYDMFALLVDGHSRDYNHLGGVAPERGLPPEGSDVRREVEHQGETDCHGLGCADHTFSWVTPREFHEAVERYERGPARRPYPLDPEWHALDAYLSRLAQAGEVRLVIGFDN